MLVFHARNVNTMLPEVLKGFKGPHAQKGDSRNGPVLTFPFPVGLAYWRPLERVSFDATRDANPFFHFMEAMWMLAGRQDVGFVSYYNKQMEQYSDDGDVFNAAYGYRMRHHFGVDQLLGVISELQRDPKTRQAVINLWSPSDLLKITKDKACNLSICFRINEATHLLDMTVYNRSNDAILGAVAGANPVHMSYFHQFVADSIKRDVGLYYQISNNMHVYTDHEKSKVLMAKLEIGFDNDFYQDNEASIPQLMDMDDPERWLLDLEAFCLLCGRDNILQSDFHSDFLNHVAVPIHNAFTTRKMGLGDTNALICLNNCKDPAWAQACRNWIERRIK